MHWQSRTAAILALAITASAIAPFMKPEAAAARYPQPREPQTNVSSQRLNVAVPAGTTIPVRFNEADKVVVTPQETKSLTLEVARAITSRNGTTLIPAGSKLIGQLQPAQGGSQFVASELIVSPGQRQERRYFVNGRSRIVTRTEQVRRGVNTGNIIKGAAIGGAAAAALAALIGDRAIATEEILGGTGLGALGGLLLNRRQVEVVIVYPNQDLAVRLDSEIALR